ncbi:MAG: phosphohydrolase, partial [Chitinophagaceae bacterium]
MNRSAVYKQTEQFVTKLFRENERPELTYHNLNHTRSVVNKAQEIAGHYSLSEDETLALHVASWFHDTGYLNGPAADHEERGVEYMRDFMREEGVSEEISDKAAGCIMATKSPRTPQALIEEIICDADTYNLGSKDFKESNKLVWRELQALGDGSLTKHDYNEATYRLMEEHRFFTGYAKDLLKNGKTKNMKKLSKKKQELEMEIPEITEKAGTTKGMQTLLRLTSQNHIQLSEIADSKANILISVNAIIISVILSVLLRKLQTDPYLGIPTAIFLLSSVVTIIVAILATRPKVTMGTFEDDDVVNKKTNLLFFGNFHRVSQDKYERAMREMMKDSDYLYSSIVQDIYHLGSVLGR